MRGCPILHLFVAMHTSLKNHKSILFIVFYNTRAGPKEAKLYWSGHSIIYDLMISAIKQLSV